MRRLKLNPKLSAGCAVVAAILFGVVYGTWARNSITPARLFRVHGPSMGLACPGRIRAWSCSHCNFPVRMIDDVAQPAALVCPNCAQRFDVSGPGSLDEGVLLQVVDAADAPTAPERWQLVGIDRQPHWWVKRVVGLPGERVEIKDGQLLIDGQLMRKSIDEFHQLAVLVHDDAYRLDATHRWLSDPRFGWQATANGYLCKDPGHRTDVPASLAYQHREPFLPAASPHVIYDGYGCNQQVSRQLNPVRDLMLDLRLSIDRSAVVELVYGGTDPPIRARFDRPGQVVELIVAAHVQQRIALPDESTWHVQFGVWDETAHLQVEGAAVASTLDPHWSPPRPAFQIVATAGGSGGGCRVEHLRIYRDLYYLPAGAQQWQLRSDEYFLLGDNVPLSRDSRHVELGPVPRTDLRGIITKGTKINHEGHVEHEEG